MCAVILKRITFSGVLDIRSNKSIKFLWTKKTEQQKQIRKKSHLVHTHSLQVAATLGISPSIKSVNIETSRNLRWKYMP